MYIIISVNGLHEANVTLLSGSPASTIPLPWQDSIQN